MGRSFCVSAPTNWNKLPAKLRREINYNIFRRKVKLFFFININIVLYLFIVIKSTCYIYLFSFVSFLSHTVE